MTEAYIERDMREVELTNVGFSLLCGPHKFLCRYRPVFPQEAGGPVRRPAGAIAVHDATGRYLDIAWGLMEAKDIALSAIKGTIILPPQDWARQFDFSVDG